MKNIILFATIIAAILCGYAAGRIEEKNKNHTKECNQSEIKSTKKTKTL